MSGTLSTEASVEPNLTPMLDMVFQLITFFMLVVNFKSAAIDHDLHLPVVGSARMADLDVPRQLVVLNLDAQGVLRAGGEVQNDVAKYLREQARQTVHPADETSTELSSIVVIRADEAARFQALGRLIKACQENGFVNFALKTADKAQQRRRASRITAKT